VAANLHILVLGASGMLGSAVQHTLAGGAGWCVDGTQRQDRFAPNYLDILEMPREDWSSVLRRRAYDYIVNCIGILKAAMSEQVSMALCRAIRVNALFPHELAAMAPDSRILHASTDGVYSGSLGRPYVETDPTDCPDAYGKTKALGECPATNVVNIRCSLIGRDVAGGKGLIEWVLRTPDVAELTGYDDQHWNGVTTRQFAELCRRIIESRSFDRVRRESGLHHFCPNPVATKYEMLCRIREAAGRKVIIRRGRSGAPGGRILGSIYSSLRGIYADSPDWNPVIRDALASE
jgi:dTDP-4-dehydrorhamnose reductase